MLSLYEALVEGIESLKMEAAVPELWQAYVMLYYHHIQQSNRQQVAEQLSA